LGRDAQPTPACHSLRVHKPDKATRPQAPRRWRLHVTPPPPKHTNPFKAPQIHAHTSHTQPTLGPTPTWSNGELSIRARACPARARLPLYLSINSSRAATPLRAALSTNLSTCFWFSLPAALMVGGTQVGGLVPSASGGLLFFPFPTTAGAKTVGTGRNFAAISIPRGGEGRRQQSGGGAGRPGVGLGDVGHRLAASAMEIVALHGRVGGALPSCASMFLRCPVFLPVFLVGRSRSRFSPRRGRAQSRAAVDHGIFSSTSRTVCPGADRCGANLPSKLRLRGQRKRVRGPVRGCPACGGQGLGPLRQRGRPDPGRLLRLSSQRYFVC
jgi:hypothetical protein